MNSIILTQKDGVVVADSRVVAKDFGKRHDHLLQNLKTLEKSISPENWGQYFVPSTYEDSTGKTNPCYLLTRDGFTLLVMGFTGQEALTWKLQYIDAFNEMEKKLTQPKAMTQIEVLSEVAKHLVEQEKSIKMVAAKTDKIETRIDHITDALTGAAAMDWAADMNSRINGLCKMYDLEYRTFRVRLYTQLESIAHCDLAARKRNLVDRLRAQGATETACRKVSKLQVIADDPKLRNIFENIVRMEQVKYAGQEANG